MLSEIAWPVAKRSARGYSRPELLAAALADSDVVSPTCRYLDHGRGRETGVLRGCLPGRALRQSGREVGILSPVFLAGHRGRAGWIDLYDDWSLAPNINPYYRLLAADGYRRVRKGVVSAPLITVNSRYMADLLLPARTVVVPNGVESGLGEIDLQGPTRPRLVLLGEFFPGRTDYALMERLVLRGEFSDVVVLGPGGAPRTTRLLRRLASLRPNLFVEHWREPDEFGQISGPATVVLLPHLVSDYTLSQDPLKVYQALALGVKVICPRLLWPEHLDTDFVLLLDHGIDLDAVLGEFLSRPGPDQRWRERFVESQGWKARAAVVAEGLQGA